MRFHLTAILRRAGFGLGGAVLALVGIGFLTGAAWITLVELRDAQFAALVLGLAYLGAGLLVVVLAGRPQAEHPPVAKQRLDMTGLGAAFAQGFGAGAATRSAVSGRGGG